MEEEGEVSRILLPGLPRRLSCSSYPGSSLPEAGQDSLHNEEEPIIADQGAQSRPLQPEEQRAGARPRRRRDLGSRLQAQRRAQRVAWTEVDENEEEAVIPGERDPA